MAKKKGTAEVTVESGAQPVEEVAKVTAPSSDVERNTERVKAFSQSIAKVRAELAKDVVGQQEIIDNVLIAIVAGGNVLLEGVPGVGKTRLV
ncbi:MAG: AAA family ATPase, partial [Clostridia bacterium]|nr:AAA family ATPase [Clostridia bacterium]